MAIINVLSPHVADMIAAGEVVERPASVIKELMENSLDAHARNLTVEIRGGGATYIRVTDDGCGMLPEDAGVAFLRHATSKLHDERGLEAISTMGFRGEALAAISAVSRIELRTRVRGGDGTRVTLEAGDIQEMGPCGCPEGTAMTVRDIFYNTPARLKFLKSDRSEGSACVQAALKTALGHPEVSVRMIRDGQEEFFSPGDGLMSSCVYTLLGREAAQGFLELNANGGNMSVTGYVSSPAAGRGSRAGQYFFCNGRYIKSPLIQSALEQAYKNTLLTGRFPACVLYLSIGCGSVDVNVHPAKTEVKFSHEKQVFDLVYQAVKLALEREDATAKIELSPATMKLAGLSEQGRERTLPAQPVRTASRSEAGSPAKPLTNTGTAPGRTPGAGGIPGAGAVFGSAGTAGSGSARRDEPQARSSSPASAGLRAPGGGFYREMTAEDFRANGYSVPRGGAKNAGPTSTPGPGGTLPGAAAAADTARREAPAQNAMNIPANGTANVPANIPIPDRSATLFDADSQGAPERGNMHGEAGDARGSVEKSVQNVEKNLVPDHKIVGEALKTYIIAELGDELVFIDKHAAHERMIFDRLKAQKREIMSQQLLAPLPLRLTDEQAELIEQSFAALSELGFEIEPYGERAYILRAVPCDIDAADAPAAVEELCEKLAAGRTLDPASARDELLHTVACKAAIKAGWDTDRRELERLVDAVLSGQVKYCPHGRPVSFVMTRRELDKQFKRIV